MIHSLDVDDNTAFTLSILCDLLDHKDREGEGRRLSRPRHTSCLVKFVKGFVNALA
jgi:hypothetical protein